MVARKSSRVKKTTVVYQAPEQVPRSPRNAPHKVVTPRRSFNRDIELYMECVDDELSPAQLKAIKEAQKEHEKANDLIKEVRAGNTLVPSSQPNTFTIVPPKPSPAPPPKPPPAPKVQASAFSSAPIQLDASSQRGLPPPRPAQFLSKQLQEIKKSTGTKISPEVILISDSTASSGTGKVTSVNVPLAHISGTPLPVQQMNSLLAPQGSGVASQQVYKFVSLPSNMPANILTNQWTLKPVLAGVAQQQMTLVSPTSRAITNVAQIAAAKLSQDQMPAPRSTASAKHVKADNPSPTLKRPLPTDASTLQPPVKKKTQGTKAAEPNELGGNWVPLDEYYYGTHEGDTSYTEEKGEYRFKCWYCSKMLYNNVRAMQHIQGHIDASKQQNIDLSDLTQCKHCYKQFDTPFEMQTHVEKVHLSNKVLMCRICEKDFSTPMQLTVHMKSNHHACEMPYVCHLCNFRSSMYSDVVDHFKKKHDSSHYMLCLYCLRTFEVKFVNQGWGQTQTYYGHLLKHQTKSATKKCVVCRLTFFNTQDVKNHRKNCHMGHFKDVKVYSPGGKADTGQKPRKGSNLKSLNAPSVSRIQDYGDIIFPAEASNTKCVECKMMMSTTDHYKKYVHCTMCRFATSCSVAYANHMMGFHSGQMSSLNLNIPWERPMKEIMFCACGFSSKYGNKIANHLVYCGKWTSYLTRRCQSEISSGASGESKKEGSILGMLGLVQKSSVFIIKDSDEIRSKPKLDNKPKEIQTKKSEDVDEDVNKRSVTKEKMEEKKPITEDLKVRKMSEEKETINTTEVETKQNVVTDASKKPDEEIDKPKDICENKKSPADIEEEVKDAEKDNLTKEADIINLDSEDENSENHKSEEVESKSIKLVNDAAAESEETKKEVETVTEETSCVAPTENKGVKTNEEEVMEQETTNELDVETGVEEDVVSDKENEIASKETEEKNITDGKEEDEKETMDIPTDVTEDRSAEELVDKEEMESMEEEDKQNEPETSIESPKVEESHEKENAKLDTETCVEKSPEVKEMDVDAESMDTEENVADNEEVVEEVKETTDVPKEHVTEGNNVQEEENKQSGEEQGVVEPSPVEKTSKVNEENKPKEDDIPKEGNESKEEEKDKEVDVEREKSADRASSSDRRASSDRSSQDRHRDSSERHSIERRDSRDRHHSGSSERSKYDDRARRDDRHRQDNRSHGSNRSDSYHSNRSSYDQNRDRSYDRDRDYNRNRDYRHGDNRSGHGYQDNRGYGGQGHRGQQGQYGGYQGNRGGNNQDRSYNRNYQNRGGYNQNYRGNHRGGYY